MSANVIDFPPIPRRQKDPEKLAAFLEAIAIQASKATAAQHALVMANQSEGTIRSVWMARYADHIADIVRAGIVIKNINLGGR